MLRPVRWAAAAVLGVLATALAAWALTPAATPEALASRFTPEHVEFLFMVDSAPQRRAHLAAFLATALACVVVAVLRSKPAGPTRRLTLPAWRWALGPLVAVGWCVVVDAPPAALASSALVVLALPALAAAPRLARLVVVALVVGWAAFLLLPGIFTTPDLATAPPWPLLFLEWHYAYVVSAGDRLAAGMKLFTDVVPPYGVLVPTLLGGFERARGLLSWGAHVQLVHVMNLLFVLAAAAAAVSWFRRLPGVVVTVLAVLPWVSSFHQSTMFPNQSAYRFLALPVALLALSWLSQRRAWWGPGFGLLTGGLLVFNPETAVAMAAGFFVFLVLRSESRAAFARTCAVAAATALLPVAAWVVLFRALLGEWPFPPDAGALLDVARRFSGGYGGFTAQKVEIALVVLAHAVFCVVVAFARRRVGRRGALRAAVGATIVVWFAYYANRGSAANLWSYLFLSSFLFDVWLHPRVLASALRHARRGQLSARTATFALIFAVPPITGNVSAFYRVLEQGFSPAPPADVAAQLSGVWLPLPAVRLLEEKAAYLAQNPDHFTVTTNGYLMPMLTGRFQASPMGDVFAESMTPADTERLVQWLRARRPAQVLFDDPESPLTPNTPQQRYFDRLRASLAGDYEVAGTTAGWLVLRRKTAQ